MEREIKVGQVWRNVHGEVTIKDTTGRIIDRAWVITKEYQSAINEHDFRATHEWVRDPVEAPKVGDWVKWGSCLPHEVVFSDGRYVRFRDGPDLVLIEKVEPCDPPPLHKALGELVERFKSYDSTRSREAEQNLADAARTVARLYEGGER